MEEKRPIPASAFGPNQENANRVWHIDRPGIHQEEPRERHQAHTILLKNWG